MSWISPQPLKVRSTLGEQRFYLGRLLCQSPVTGGVTHTVIRKAKTNSLKVPKPDLKFHKTASATSWNCGNRTWTDVLLNGYKDSGSKHIWYVTEDISPVPPLAHPESENNWKDKSALDSTGGLSYSRVLN